MRCAGDCLQHGCVVSGASDGQVKVWSHRGIEITTLHGHTQRVNGCDVFVKCRSVDGQSETELLLTTHTFVLLDLSCAVVVSILTSLLLPYLR